MEKYIDFKPIYLPENKGLGNALREAINNCTHNLIARMDSDDISTSNRFELELNQFYQNPHLDIVGGNITEFNGKPEEITGQRTVLGIDSEIKNDMKKRCAMNHVSVMYKKEAVQSAGGYLDWPWNEDYYLWIRMLENGCTFANIPYNLVNVRTGKDMSARRGGWKYFRSEQTLQKYMLDHKLISTPQYFCNVAIRFGGEVVAPNWLRSKLFMFTRKNYNSQVNASIPKEQIKIEEYPPFSVAMSVYGKDNAEWFDIALNSIIDQTVKPSEIVLVVDGPVPQPIYDIIDKYAEICKLGGISKSNKALSEQRIG